MSKQPIQPVVFEKGNFLFQPNRVVQFLFCQTKHELNDLQSLGFCASDMEQFAQLIGCAVHRFCHLPFVTEQTASEVERERLKVQEHIDEARP